jgi:hypothetical protein
MSITPEKNMPITLTQGNGIETDYTVNELEDALHRHAQIGKDLPNGKHANIWSRGEAGYGCYIDGMHDELWAPTLAELLEQVKQIGEEELKSD